MIENQIKAAVRDIPDFPKPGIIFKDITTIFQDADLCSRIIDAFVVSVENLKIDAIAGVESRGFLFGPAIAMRLGIPFIPIRKAGKLPGVCLQESYELEYGHATIEIHEGSIEAGKRVLLHDDLLATGGTILAASNLINKLDAEVVACAFIIELGFLEGTSKLEENKLPIISLAKYT